MSAPVKHLPPVEAGLPTRRAGGIVLPVLAAVAVIVIAAAALLVNVLSTTHHHTTPPPAAVKPKPVPLHTSSVVLARGTVGSRADIPWNQVGPGWTLAVWSPNPTQSTSKAPLTVFLVNPVGGRYEVTTLPADEGVSTWSPNHQLMLLSKSVFNLVTGTSTPFHVPSNVGVTGFTADSLGLLGLAQKTDASGAILSGTLERFSLTGKVETLYPSSVPGMGKLSGRYTDQPTLNTPDGKGMAVGADKGIVILNNAGKVVRTIAPIQAGGLSVSCTPQSFWSSTVLLALCTDNTQKNSGALWKIPTDGGTPTQFTGFATQPYFAFIDAWQTSGGIVGLSEAGCGPPFLVRFGAHMQPSMFTGTRPAGAGKNGGRSYIGHYGDTITMLYQSGGCMTNVNTLANTSAVTGKSVALLGPGMNGGNVVNAISANHEVLY